MGTKNDSDPLRAASTHLFASDPKHLFDEVSLYQWVNVPESHEVVIPCRPTDPDRVTMRFLREGMQDITDRLADFHYRYEPRRGLVIEEVTAQFHTGMIVCVAKRWGEKKGKEGLVAVGIGAGLGVDVGVGFDV